MGAFFTNVQVLWGDVSAADPIAELTEALSSGLVGGPYRFAEAELVAPQPNIIQAVLRDVELRPAAAAGKAGKSAKDLFARLRSRVTVAVNLTPRRAGAIPLMVRVTPLAGDPKAHMHVLQLVAEE
jgi:hypothetical protein